MSAHVREQCQQCPYTRRRMRIRIGDNTTVGAGMPVKRNHAFFTMTLCTGTTLKENKMCVMCGAVPVLHCRGELLILILDEFGAFDFA